MVIEIILQGIFNAWSSGSSACISIWSGNCISILCGTYIGWRVSVCLFLLFLEIFHTRRGQRAQALDVLLHGRKLVGKTFNFTKKDKNSGLAKSKDKLSVTVSNGDSAKVAGTVNGKKLSASLPLLVSGKETAGGVTAYTLYVDIIEPTLKYERTLVITATVDSAGKVSASAAFAK